MTLDHVPEAVLRAAELEPRDVRALPWQDPIWRADHQRLGALVLSIAPMRDPAWAEWEATLLDHLEATGFPSPRAARAFDGLAWHLDDHRLWTARTWISGRLLSDDPQPDLSAVGNLLATYHLAVGDLTMPQRPGIESVPELLQRADVDAILRMLGPEGDDFPSMAARLLQELNNHSGDAVTIHGDFTDRNVLLGESKVHAVIDFGMAHRAPAVADLGWRCGRLGSHQTSSTSTLNAHKS